MNLHIKPPIASARPAEPTRRRWTADELEKLVASGIIHEEERVELIDGEILTMAAKGRRHEIVRNELMMNWARRLPLEIKLAEEPAFRLQAYNEPEPDILVFSSSQYVPDVRGDTALLVVEVSYTTLSFDLKIKAPLYATYGVQEYWVVDARTLTTTVHRAPGPTGYADVREYAQTELITPLAVPALAVRLADLGIEPPEA
jgi:Uma2 family endonuclease